MKHINDLLLTALIALLALWVLFEAYPEKGYTDEQTASMDELVRANDDVLDVVPRLSVADLGEME